MCGECKFLECGSQNCKVWMSMMLPEGVDVENEMLNVVW